MTTSRIDYPALFPHVIEGYIQGKSQMAIATALNTHPSHVSRTLRVHNLSHYKLLKLIQDSLTAEQIIQFATAKEPEFLWPEPGTPIQVPFASLIRDIEILEDQLAGKTHVIQQQAQTIKTYWECSQSIQEALTKLEYLLGQQDLAEHQKAGAV